MAAPQIHNQGAQGQLDVPQISLARYLDLLKRRKWQTIPVSILGLLIGGIAALMVPRYFEAEVDLKVEYSLLDSEPVMQDDPMRELVQDAKQTIPSHVSEAIAELGWPEYMAADDTERGNVARAVEERIDVVDLDRRERRRTARLKVRYTDLSGERSYQLVNRVVSLWRDNELSQMQERGRRELQGLGESIKRAQDSVDLAQDQLQEFLKEHGLLEQAGADGVPYLAGVDVDRELARATDDRNDVEKQIRTLTKRLEVWREQLETMDKTVASSEVDPALKALANELLVLQEQEFQLQAALALITPSHPHYPGRKLQLEEHRKKVAFVREQLQGAGGSVLETPNPRFLELQDKAANATVELEERQTELDQLQAEIEELKERRTELPGLQGEYARLRSGLEMARSTRDRLAEKRDAQLDLQRELEGSNPVSITRLAQLPEAPTEPGITLVALLGMLIGLGAAIAGILVWDLVQATYKTVEDVERSLAVPVLGTMAWLENDLVRVRQVQQRRRVSVITAIAALGLVAMVTLYFLDRSLLPLPVVELLDLLLKDPVRGS